MKKYPFFARENQDEATISRDCQKRGGRPLKDHKHRRAYLLIIFAFAVITFISYSCKLTPLIFTPPTATPTITPIPTQIRAMQTLTPHELEIFGSPVPDVPLKAMRGALIERHYGPAIPEVGEPVLTVMITYYLLPDTTFADVEKHYSQEAGKAGWVLVTLDADNQVLGYQSENQWILLTYLPGDKEQKRTPRLELALCSYAGRKF